MYVGATSEYPATHSLLNLLLPWSAVGYQGYMYVLSVEPKCYCGPQSRSRWITIKLRVEVKCNRGPQSCSGWKNEEYSWCLYTVYYVNYVDCGTEVAGFWVVFQLRGILKFTQIVSTVPKFGVPSRFFKWGLIRDHLWEACLTNTKRSVYLLTERQANEVYTKRNWAINSEAVFHEKLNKRKSN